MSDSEDFIYRIDAEELYPEVIFKKKLKRKKIKIIKHKKNKKNQRKNMKIMPNYFVAFRIYDSHILQKIAEIQSSIIDKNPLLKSVLIDPRTLHVTLAVTHLKSEEKMKELQERLQDWGEKDMREHFKTPMLLTFKGIGTFKKAVAFVKISECENYKRLCNLSLAVNDLLTEFGFYSETRRKFTPHLTLMKLSKNYELFKDRKNFSDQMKSLTECNDDFGSQEVKDIQLLSMKEKDINGYYKCLWQLQTVHSSEEFDA